MEKYERSIELFYKGFNCVQSTTASFCKIYTEDEKAIYRALSALGGGIARSGETCGAVLGALIIIGLRYGIERPEQQEQKQKSYDLANEFIDEFLKRNGSLKCKELVGEDDIAANAPVPDENQKKKEACSKLIVDAVDIVGSLL